MQADYSGIKQAIELALPVFAKFPKLNDSEIRKEMLSAGVSKALVDEILAFVPIAFGRILLRPLELNLKPTYERVKFENGEWVVVEKAGLWSHLVFRISSGFALRMRGPEFLNVAFRSAEVKLVNEFERQGVELNSIVFTNLQVDYEIEKEC